MQMKIVLMCSIFWLQRETKKPEKRQKARKKPPQKQKARWTSGHINLIVWYVVEHFVNYTSLKCPK